MKEIRSPTGKDYKNATRRDVFRDCVMGVGVELAFALLQAG